MRQEIISYLTTCDNEIKELCKFLYNNPEHSYQEEKACDYICSLLEKHNFDIQKNYLDINNSFVAKKGNGHPKICFLCEYDAVDNMGHITGHNMLTSISTLAAITLGYSIENIIKNGSIILIGCPGEYLGGTKEVLAKQGVFDDIDVVMAVHPDIETCESGSCSAIIPLSVKFKGDCGLSFMNKNKYTALDATLLLLTTVKSLEKTYPEGLEINTVLSNGGYTPLLLPCSAEAKFYIRAKNIESARYGDDLIRKISTFISSITNMECEFSLYECPNRELITNRTLNRLFSHNLKQSGIIDIKPPKDIYAGLSIGTVSHKVPCIHPYIDITENNNIKYGSLDFADSTITDFAFERCHRAALALVCTSIDLIENKNLLAEIKEEFYNTIKK